MPESTFSEAVASDMIFSSQFVWILIIVDNLVDKNCKKINFFQYFSQFKKFFPSFTDKNWNSDGNQVSAVEHSALLLPNKFLIHKSSVPRVIRQSRSLFVGILQKITDSPVFLRFSAFTQTISNWTFEINRYSPLSPQSVEKA